MCPWHGPEASLEVQRPPQHQRFEALDELDGRDVAIPVGVEMRGHFLPATSCNHEVLVMVCQTDKVIIVDAVILLLVEHAPEILELFF